MPQPLDADTLAALAAAGLYDASSPTADERRELLAFLVEEGCTIEEMQGAQARGRLFALAGDRIIRPDHDRLTLAEVAAQTGRDLDVVRRLWRAFGLVEVGPDDRVAAPADVAAVATTLELADFVGVEPIIGLGRVVGGALARIGDAVSSVVRTNLPAMSVAISGSELTTARTYRAAADFVPRLSGVLDALFRHHLENARMHFERTESWDIVGRSGIRVGIGFADVSGFTGMSAQMSLDQLSGLLSRFEEVACDTVADHHGRVVKFIGDAVMFVTADPSVAAGLAAALLDAARDNGLTARAGVTTGDVLALDGDYFGPAVNLAARLAAMAPPDEIFANAELVERLPAGVPTESLGRRGIRGFGEPIEVYRVLPTRDRSGSVGERASQP